MGEAPVTPVSSLDSSPWTYPTNRAITVYKQVRSLVVEYSARIRYSHRLDTGGVREVHIGSNNRMQKSMVFIGYREVQCENVCNQIKF